MTTVDTPMSFLPQGDKRTVPGALPRVSTGTLQTSTHLGTTVICLSGDHDLTNAADLSEAIERAVIDADVIVDLNGADFIDSSILHALTRGV